MDFICAIFHTVRTHGISRLWKNCQLYVISRSPREPPENKQEKSNVYVATLKTHCKEENADFNYE